jgi:NAD(P)-dependent dehydrogenase (short-subunit alcohol dehydrogenase family)
VSRRLQGQRAAVTGASRGIGRAIAIRFASEGADLILVARDKGPLKRVATEVEVLGRRAIVVSGDITKEETSSGLASAVEELDGIDILVNNAGVFLQQRFMDYSLDDWQTSWEINVMGAVRMTRTVLPRMVEAGNGRIINIASTAGKWGTPYQTAYNATKHALVGLTRSLALEVAANGVRVTAICPANVDTDMVDKAAFARTLGIAESEVERFIVGRIPIGRLLKPEEVAELAVFLASPEGDAVTGVGLTIAGGLSLI